MGDTFAQCAGDLASGKTVLFSGTGCQIQGLLNFLAVRSVDTSRLLTVDLVCHGVPSPGIWESYISELEARSGQKVVSVNFRDKNACGWKAHKERITFEDGSSRLEDVWTNLFYSNTILRPSCFTCVFATTVRKSDFTIGDYWGIEKNAPEFDDDKGVNLVLVNTERGRETFSKLEDIDYRTTVLSNSLQPNLIQPSSVDASKRRRVMNDYRKKQRKRFVDRYLRKRSLFYLKSKVKNKLRSFLGA
jgi:coenzyme F420-reducing hydrogenase beta subunit